ncbi:Uncharacterised protein [uncultured archaeon]|nr:Uncharacterised protein [uncultured archaeon]
MSILRSGIPVLLLLIGIFISIVGYLMESTVVADKSAFVGTINLTTGQAHQPTNNTDATAIKSTENDMKNVSQLLQRYGLAIMILGAVAWAVQAGLEYIQENT